MLKGERHRDKQSKTKTEIQGDGKRNGGAREVELKEGDISHPSFPPWGSLPAPPCSPSPTLSMENTIHAPHSPGLESCLRQ